MATFVEKPNGHWLARIRKRGIKKSREFKEEKDARLWAGNVERAIDLDMYDDKLDNKKSDILFSAVIDTFIKEKLPTMKTYHKDISCYERLKETKIAKKKFVDIRPADCTAFKKARQAQVSDTTVLRELARLSSCYSYGLKQMELNEFTQSANPFFLIEKPKAKAKTPSRYIENDLLNIMLNEIQRVHPHNDTRVCDAIKFAIATSLRRGDIVKLRQSNVDFVNKTIEVLEPKNDEDRFIPLLPDAEAILEKYKKKGNALFFDIKADSLTQAVTRAKQRLKKQGKEVQFRFHWTRKTAISNFIFEGLAEFETSTISGHKDVQTMKKHYAEFSAMKLREKIMKIRENKTLASKESITEGKSQ